MGPRVYISGKLHEKSDARISVFDHGLLYGDGVFEGIRAYGGRLFRLAEHLDRLYASARAIRLTIPMTHDELARAVEQTLAANDLADAYVRVIVTRGAGSLDLDPRKTTDPQVIIITDQISPYPRELYEYGLKVVTIPAPPSPLGPDGSRIPSLSSLSLVMAKAEAIAAGCLEALLVDRQGWVLGGTAGNLFLVREGVLHTPSIGAGVVDGITRRVVLELAAVAGYPVVERPLARYDVETAVECFLSGTAAELIPVVECDGRALGPGRPGPVTGAIRERFEALVRGDDESQPGGGAEPSLRSRARDRDQDHPRTD